MINWFKDTIAWFRKSWPGWIAIAVYIAVLYWMAGMNWQVIRFPIFFGIFCTLSFVLVVVFRYLKSPGE